MSYTSSRIRTSRASHWSSPPRAATPCRAVARVRGPPRAASVERARSTQLAPKCMAVMAGNLTTSTLHARNLLSCTSSASNARGVARWSRPALTAPNVRAADLARKGYAAPRSRVTQ